MPFAPRVAACLLLPLLAACASPADAPPAIDPGLRDLVSRLPAELADFEMQESAPNAASVNAWSVRYSHARSGAVATVMLNKPGEPSVPDGADSPAIQAVVNTLSLGVQAALGGGGLTRVPDFGAARPGRLPEARCSDLRITTQQGPLQRVLVCASGAGGGVVAVSVTVQHPPGAMDTARLFMTNFVLQAVRALQVESAQDPSGIPNLRAPSGRVFRL
jgi:hypothetical protein